jgi:hypothetical protein
MHRFCCMLAGDVVLYDKVSHELYIMHGYVMWVYSLADMCTLPGKFTVCYNTKVLHVQHRTDIQHMTN